MWNFIKSFGFQQYNEVYCAHSVQFGPMFHLIAQDIFSYFTTPTVDPAGYRPSLDDKHYQAYCSWSRRVKREIKQLRNRFVMGIKPEQLSEVLLALQTDCVSPAYYADILQQLADALQQHLQSPQVFLAVIDDAYQTFYKSFEPLSEGVLIHFYDDAVNGVLDNSRKNLRGAAD